MQLHLATLAIDQGEYTKSYGLLEDLKICRELNDQSGIAEVLTNLAERISWREISLGTAIS